MSLLKPIQPCEANILYLTAVQSAPSRSGPALYEASKYVAYEASTYVALEVTGLFCSCIRTQSAPPPIEVHASKTQGTARNVRPSSATVLRCANNCARRHSRRVRGTYARAAHRLTVGKIATLRITPPARSRLARIRSKNPISRP